MTVDGLNPSRILNLTARSKTSPITKWLLAFLFAEETAVPRPIRPTPAPPPKDRLTVSLWGLKVEGVGRGVSTALVVVAIFAALSALSLLLAALRA